MACWWAGWLLLLAETGGARLEQGTLESWAQAAPRLGNASGFQASSLQRRLPQGIIIGVRKGGTRALLEMLALHPQVAAARSEVHFFNREENYRRGLGWYRQQMPLSRPGQLTVEKTPGYFSSPRVPARVRALAPGMRLPLIVRDPVERLVSDYTQILHNRQARCKPYPPLEQLLVRGDRGLDTRYKPIQRSLYALHLARWLAAFPPAHIHVVDGGSLIREPLAELRRMEQFLGLAPRLGPDNFCFYCLQAGARQLLLQPDQGLLLPAGRGPPASTSTRPRASTACRPGPASFYFNQTKGFYCLQAGARQLLLQPDQGLLLPAGRGPPALPGRVQGAAHRQAAAGAALHLLQRPQRARLRPGGAHVQLVL
ncbi:unnamed protein product, partial [Caretta caretta]